MNIIVLLNVPNMMISEGIDISTHDLVWKSFLVCFKVIIRTFW